jgi:hypothetical protein
VEAFAEMNGEKDVETFVSLVNEALIRVLPKVSAKTDNKE